MVRLRLRVREERQQLFDLKLLFQYARKLIESAAEASFLGISLLLVLKLLMRIRILEGTGAFFLISLFLMVLFPTVIIPNFIIPNFNIPNFIIPNGQSS